MLLFTGSRLPTTLPLSGIADRLALVADAVTEFIDETKSTSHEAVFLLFCLFFVLIRLYAPLCAAHGKIN